MRCQSSPTFAFWLILAYKVHKKHLFVCGLQSRSYIAECFRLLCAILEDQKGCHLLVQFFCDIWCVSRGPPKLPKFLPIGNACVYTQCYCTAHPMCTTDGSQRIILCSDVPFVDVNDVPLNIWSHTPKTEILSPWIGVSSVSDNKFKHHSSFFTPNYSAGVGLQLAAGNWRTC